jgi:hypothetical protein
LSPLQIDIMLAILFDHHLSPLNVSFHSPIYGEIMRNHLIFRWLDILFLVGSAGSIPRVYEVQIGTM